MPATVSPRILGAAALLTGLGLALSAETPSRERTLVGRTEKIGTGTIQGFVTLDPAGAPLAVGVRLSAGALEQLPQVPNTVSRCFDLDGNGRYTGHECMGDEERILELPAVDSAVLPFSWIMMNWNPAGHQNTPYAQPHFDFHFYMVDRSEIEAIAPGRCGEMVDCGDFKRGSVPVPARYLPSGYIDVGAVAPRMGNHLLDSQSPELKDSLPFSSTFIFGTYQGEVTFWEPMITLGFLQKTHAACLPIRQPNGFRQAGYYPTQYCVRQDRDGQRTVSLERFRYAEAL
jgi:hypothetical protein